MVRKGKAASIFAAASVSVVVVVNLMTGNQNYRSVFYYAFLILQALLAHRFFWNAASLLTRDMADFKYWDNDDGVALPGGRLGARATMAGDTIFYLGFGVPLMIFDLADSAVDNFANTIG
ncbi:hypothetical protein [Sphingomonas crocodyli]|uniref:Uncharacterized protein n=1 Tax=Sphingomonas crocodyli TaxID=1979270 RepID=A0A437M966_9SPHN|nr:hypothetical protein [Sphingomonas crocodyli]RVT94136.1 hypothetical protein EOD43_09870 [Sphingomonas crocodyli]